MAASLDVTNEERAVAQQIAERAMGDLREARKHDRFEMLDIWMDIAATHANGCPLRLEELRDADGFNFAHDVLGIRRHLNRDTGKLEGHFLPRFAVPQGERAE